MSQRSINSLDDLILLRIFNYLNLKTLLKCRKICKKWNNLVNEIFNIRNNKIETFLYYKQLEGSTDFLPKQFLIHQNDFKNDLNSELEMFSLNPSVILCLMTKRLKGKCILTDDQSSAESEREIHSNKRVKRNNSQLVKPANVKSSLSVFKNMLPNFSTNLFIFTSGVIGVDSKRTRLQEIEALNKREFGISGLALPKHDKFRVGITRLVTDRRFNTIQSEQDLNDYLGVKESECLKYLFLFVNKSCKLKLEKLFEVINEIRNSREDKRATFCVSGGYIDSAIYCDESTEYNVILMSFITSKLDDDCSQNVFNVAEIVLPFVEKEQSDLMVNRKLESLRESADSFMNEKSISFAFQVCCVGRGKEYYGKENFESQIFKNHFPNIPLVGFYGYGEIGMDHLPGKALNPNDEFLNLKWHFYCTVFTLISININN